MVAELTPLHETCAGKELLEEGVERGRREGIDRGIERGTAALVHRMAGKGKAVADISGLTDLPIEEVERLLASGVE